MTLEEAKSQLLEIKKYNEKFKTNFERRPGIVSTIKLNQIIKDNKAIETAIRSLDLLIQLEEETENDKKVNKIFRLIREEIEKNDQEEKTDEN